MRDVANKIPDPGNKMVETRIKINEGDNCDRQSGEDVKETCEESETSESRKMDAETEADEDDEVFKDKQEQRESKEGGAKLLRGQNENIHNSLHKDTTKENKTSTEGTNRQHGYSSEDIVADSPKLKDDRDQFSLDRVSTDQSKKHFLKRWFRKLFSVPFSCYYCCYDCCCCGCLCGGFSKSSTLIAGHCSLELSAEFHDGSDGAILTSEWIKSPRKIGGGGSQGGQGQGQGKGQGQGQGA